MKPVNNGVGMTALSILSLVLFFFISLFSMFSFATCRARCCRPCVAGSFRGTRCFVYLYSGVPRHGLLYFCFQPRLASRVARSQSLFVRPRVRQTSSPRLSKQVRSLRISILSLFLSFFIFVISKLPIAAVVGAPVLCSARWRVDRPGKGR